MKGSHLVLVAGATQSLASFAVIPVLSVVLPRAEAGSAGFNIAVATFLAILLGVGVPGSVTTAFFAPDRGPGIARGMALRAGTTLTLAAVPLAALGRASTLASALSIACSLAVLQVLLALARAEPAPRRFLTTTVSLGVLPMGASLGLCLGLGAPTGSAFLSGWAVIAVLVSGGWLLELWRTHRPSTRQSLNLRFGLPLVAHGAGLVGLSVADRVVVGVVLGPSSLAVYQLGYALGSLTPPLLNAVNNVLAPSIYRQERTDVPATLTKVTRRNADLAWVSSILNCAMAVPAAFLLQASGYSWRTVLAVAAVTTVSGLAYAGYLNTVHLYFLEENSRRLLVSTPASMVVAVLASTLLTLAFGILGTAVASVLGYLVLWAATWWGARRAGDGLSTSVSYPRALSWLSLLAVSCSVAAFSIAT